ncbi:MAG: hypothetical protein ACRCUT_15380 [Spirochaetota bacterium]
MRGPRWLHSGGHESKRKPPTPVDVMTGLTLGILTAWGMGKIYRTAEKKGRWLVCLPLSLFIIWCYFNNNPDFWKAAGAFSGICAGYIIESEIIKFTMPGKAWKIIFRLVIGFAGLVLIKAGMKPLLPDALLSDAFRYFCIGLWVSAGAPALFMKAKI